MLLKISEADVQRACLQYLALKRIFHYRNNTGAIKTERSFFRFGTVGSPDIIAVKDGQFIGIECKGPKGAQSPEQKAFQERLEAAGGRYILVKTIDDLMAVV